MVIKHKSFMHGWHYIYRMHTLKSGQLLNNGFSSINNYLNSVFNSCPDEYFLQGPRGSKLKFKVDADLRCSTNHEVSKLAKLGLEINAERFKSGHSKVQVFMLENDHKTIAIEVPLWFSPEESKLYSAILGKDPLTGHIDLLRVEDDKIWVWDYKPDAIAEKFAATQTYFYALMLSQRAGVPLNHFMCGYFDSYHALTFDPNEVKLKAAEKNLLLEA